MTLTFHLEETGHILFPLADYVSAKLRSIAFEIFCEIS